MAGAGRAAICLAALMAVVPMTTPAMAATLSVTINTTAVQGTAGKLSFDFVNADDGSINTVTILNFTTDGMLGLPETQGGLVNGDIILGSNPAPVTTIGETSAGQTFFFNQLAVVFTAFGQSITFTLQFTESHTAGKPLDQVAVVLLRRTTDQPLIVSTDPLGAHALFAVNATSTTGAQLEAFGPTQVMGTNLTAVVPPLIPVVAAVLPSSRSVQVGTPATAFVTILNAGTSDIFDAGPFLTTSLPAAFGFATTDPATNVLTGTLNTRAGIKAGQGQTYVVALTPSGPVAPTDVAFDFSGVGSTSAGKISGVNTLLFSASATPVPDIVALGATINNDGIVNIPGVNGIGVFAVATVNVGAGANITVSGDTGSATLPASVTLCQTNPSTGQCTTPIGPAVTTTMNANATATFGIFVKGTGAVPFDPATNRIFVRFKDAGGVTRGSTSVATRTQ